MTVPDRTHLGAAHGSMEGGWDLWVTPTPTPSWFRPQATPPPKADRTPWLPAGADEPAERLATLLGAPTW